MVVVLVVIVIVVAPFSIYVWAERHDDGAERSAPVLIEANLHCASLLGDDRRRRPLVHALRRTCFAKSSKSTLIAA